MQAVAVFKCRKRAVLQARMSDRLTDTCSETMRQSVCGTTLSGTLVTNSRSLSPSHRRVGVGDVRQECLLKDG